MKNILFTFLMLLYLCSCCMSAFAIGFWLEPYITLFGSSALGVFVALFLLISIGNSETVNNLLIKLDEKLSK